MSITTDDILAAIRAARVEPDADVPAMTTAELGEALGLSTIATLRYLKVAVKAGTLKPIRVKRTAIDGRVANVGAWVAVGPR